MTLSEVVIAIALIAFSVPLILAATTAAHRSRLAAEADTHSAWIVRDVQRRIINQWSGTTQNKGLDASFPFPTTGSPKAVMELSYKQDGTLISDDMNQAVYLVFVQAERYEQAPDHSTVSSLALLSIQIQHPAKAAPNKRTKLNYRFVSTRKGIW
jgi:hypothetical protein